MRFLAKDVLNNLSNLWNAGRTANQDNFIDIRWFHLGVLKRLQNGLATAFDQIIDEPFERASSDRHLQVLGACCICSDERQVDVGLREAAQFLLGLFARFLQTLQ